MEWWIRPDGTFWVSRFEDIWIGRVLAKKKYYQSIGRDVNALEASIREFESRKAMTGRVRMASYIAGKFSDEVSRNLLNQEYNALSGRAVSIITTTAVVEAVEDRYGVLLKNVRARISAPSSNQQQGQQQQQQTSPPKVVTPDAPSSLSLVAPAKASSAVKTPTIEVSGMQSGDAVKLFSDSQCSREVGSGTATGGSIRITTQQLGLGNYRFYANITRNGVTSQCSTVSTDYEVLDSNQQQAEGQQNIQQQVVVPDAPSSLSLVRPNRPSSTQRRPVVKVSGVQAEDVVKLFRDDQCTKEVGSGTAKAGNIRIRTKRRLRPGVYRFYANTTRDGVTSPCSTANAGYVVLAR